MTFDPGLMIAGHQGAFFFEDGTPMGDCRSFEVTIGFETTDERVMGEDTVYASEQGHTYELRFTRLHIDDNLPTQLLSNIRQGRRTVLSFMGEIHRPDGAVGQYIMAMAVPTGTHRLVGMEPGTTSTREHTWRLNRRPEIQQALP
jgi:hypothetical protein